MISGCSQYVQWISRSLVGDLSADEEKALDGHLAACPSCRNERDAFAETVRLLQSAEEEPAPRHFFVYPEEGILKPWQLFRQMMPRWQAATAGVIAVILAFGVLGVFGIQVKAQQEGWTLSFGRGGASAGIDTAALKAEILQAAEENNREAAREWIRNIQLEIARSHEDLTDQQRLMLAGSLSDLESRITGRLDLTAAELRSGNEKSMVDLYRTLSLEQQQQVNAVQTRIDGVIESQQERTRETDAVLETLLQVAELRFRPTGDQK